MEELSSRVQPELSQPASVPVAGAPDGATTTASLVPSVLTLLPEPSEMPDLPSPDDVAVPDSASDDLNCVEETLLCTQELIPECEGTSSLLQCTSLVAGPNGQAPPLAEDNLP